jgi:type II secretory pathway pseudopilin PulG
MNHPIRFSRNGSDQSRARQEAPSDATTLGNCSTAENLSRHRNYARSNAPQRSFTVAALNAFTIIELVVSMGILAATIVAVATIFSIGSEAASRTEAHAEILESSSALQQSLADDLSHMAGGLLIIESPPPTLVRAEVHNGPKVFRLRHDRLVFIASRGSEGTYQSVTDPTRGFPGDLIIDPVKEPISSPEALVYYGPGIPVVGNGTVAGDRKLFDDETVALPAAEWTFARRAVLLLGVAPNPPITGWTPLAITAFDNGLLSSVPDIYESRMDALVAGTNAPATLIGKIMAALTASGLATPTSLVSDLWSPNLTPVTTSLTDSTLADYYARSGFNFQLRLADFRIEWTDGRRVDPNGPDNNPATFADNDNSTRWFGLTPDRNELPDVTNLDAMKYQPRPRGMAAAGNPSNPNPLNPDNPPDENLAFGIPATGNGIEWSPTGITPDPVARYRAVWRSDPLNPSSTWQYRPKALKFTYRIYDATQRLKQNTSVDFDEDGIADPINSGNPTIPYVVTRYGQEYSFVVTLP